MESAEKKSFGGTQMPLSDREGGAALVLVMILTGVALTLTAAMIYAVTWAVQASGGHKRYESALDAAKACTEIARELVEERGNPGVLALTNFNIPAKALPTASGDCMEEKIRRATFLADGTLNWDLTCDATVAIDPAVPTSYDMTFTLGAGPSYNVFAKIADTVSGNSADESGLDIPGVVLSNPGVISVKSFPFLYTVECLAVDTVNALERGRVSVLHQY